MTVPTHRYSIRELGEEDTEWLVWEVYGALPPTWRHLGRRGMEINGLLWALADEAAYVLSAMRKLDKWGRGSIVFRAFTHLRNIGVVELRRESAGLPYVRHPIPDDPLIKPSRAPSVRAAAALVDHGLPVGESHVSVPQQAMRQLLSGALVR